MCEQYFKDKYLDVFIKCNSCGSNMQNIFKAGLAEE